MIVYFNSSFIPQEKVIISPFDRGFLFGDGVYEAMRTYNKKIFCFDEHLRRLKRSLQQLHINYNNFSEIESIIYKVADLNKSRDDFSVYLQITRGVSFPRTHYYQKSIKPNIFLYVNPLKDHRKEMTDGVRVTLEKDIRWIRCDIKSISLLPSVMANQKAVSNNNYEAIFFRDNRITEGSHTNFFAIKNETIFTAPLSNYILEGVTRGVVFYLCKENNINFGEEYINIDSLKDYEEFFITGTTTEITPVVQIDNLIVNNGKPGKITKQIQELFFKLTSSLN
jgi:D-alanine transaminase